MAESTALAALLPESLLDALRQRSLTSPPRTSGARHGEHRSQRAGLGLEFRDHRPYAPGDDLRRLDWRAAARQDRLILRQQEAEEELTATIVLDAGANMAYGEGETNKWRHATAMVGAIAYVAGLAHDRVRFAIGRDGTVDTSGLLAAPAREQQARLVDLCTQPPGGRTPWTELLESVASSSRRRGVTFVISDLLDVAYDIEQDADEALVRLCDRLAIFRTRGQTVVLVQVLHDDEVRFRWNESKAFRFEDLVKRRPVIEGVGSQLGEGFDERVGAYLELVGSSATSRGLSRLLTRTSTPLADNVLRVFSGAGEFPVEARA